MTESPRELPAQPEPPCQGPARSWSDLELRAAMAVALHIASRWCRTSQDAEDVAQEAIQRLLLQGRVSRLQAWLAVVVRRLAWRLAQDRQAEETALAEAALAAARARPADPIEARCAVRELLGHASPHDRTLLELDALGYSDEEIGQRLGCRAESVHTLLSRARERLRRLHAR